MIDNNQSAELNVALIPQSAKLVVKGGIKETIVLTDEHRRCENTTSLGKCKWFRKRSKLIQNVFIIQAI
jgi:hypothetical protein